MKEFNVKTTEGDGFIKECCSNKSFFKASKIRNKGLLLQTF